MSIMVFLTDFPVLRQKIFDKTVNFCVGIPNWFLTGDVTNKLIGEILDMMKIVYKGAPDQVENDKYLDEVSDVIVNNVIKHLTKVLDIAVSNYDKKDYVLYKALLAIYIQEPHNISFN